MKFILCPALSSNLARLVPERAAVWRSLGVADDHADHRGGPSASPPLSSEIPAMRVPEAHARLNPTATSPRGARQLPHQRHANTTATDGPGANVDDRGSKRRCKLQLGPTTPFLGGRR